MSTIELTGKVLMTLGTVIYGFIPPFVDFNATHATNPLWTGHARFHVVWQVLITICLGILGLYLLWFDQHGAFSLNLSFLLGLITLVTFEINVFARRLYNGTLADPNGVPPVFKGVDANVFAFTIALVLLVLGYWLAA